MTLFRQLVIAVLVLFVGLFAGNIFVSISNNQTLVKEQMQVHAQDTATSLGLSLTQAAQSGDMATMEVMFNAVSDSGFFRRANFKNLDGDIVIDREFPVSIENVPDWFVDAIEIPDYSGVAQVSSGWTQLGEVTVISHPGQAYKRLWEITLRQILWFALATVVACVLGWFALHRLLIPLHQVEAQAVAIGEGDFGAQSPMPKTRELRSVVGAMNRMADALKTLFSDQLDLIAKLRSEKSRDPVTGLSNREEFDSRMSAFVTSETGGHSGVLLLLDVHNLERVNEMSGRAAGNQLLATVGKVVLEALDEYAVSLVARRQGPEITAFVPDIDATEGQYIASRVFGEVSKITWDHQDSDPLYFYLGFSHTDVIESASELLQSADSALKKAAQSDRSALVNFAEIESLEAPVLRKPLEEWRQFIQSAVERRAIEIHYQPIVDVQRTNIIGSEAFARFPTENGLLSAGAIIPAAERLEMTHQLDRLIMESICEQWREKGVPHSVQINISPTTIRRENFLQLLDNFLSRNSDFAASLVLEISEHWARIDKAAVAGMNAVLNKHGAGLCIDHFGLETSSFSYIGAMNLRALKVHRSFVKDLANNPDNQFYISTLSNLARNLGIKLFVEGVETEADFLVLDSLGIDGCQGYFLAKPSAEPIVGL